MDWCINDQPRPHRTSLVMWTPPSARRKIVRLEWDGFSCSGGTLSPGRVRLSTVSCCLQLRPSVVDLFKSQRKMSGTDNSTGNLVSILRTVRLFSSKTIRPRSLSRLEWSYFKQRVEKKDVENHWSTGGHSYQTPSYKTVYHSPWHCDGWFQDSKLLSL